MKKLRVNKILITAISVILAIAAVACDGTENKNELNSNISKDGDLHTASDEQAPVILNLKGGVDYGYPSPYTHYSRGPGSYKMELVFDSLLERGEKGMIPWMAEKWEVSPDGKIYTFTLHDNIKWHDGVLVTAEDVKFSFEYFEKHPPVRANLLIDGKPFIENIDVLDNLTLKVTIDQPIACAIDNLGTSRIIPKHIWENVEEPEKFITEESAIGCGPFVIKEHNKEQGIYRFEAFSDYYGPKALVDVLQFVPVPNNNELLAFESGDIDLAAITPDVLSKYEDDTEYKVIRNPPFWGYRLMFNMEKRPELLEKEVRQAIAHAIDQQELIEKVARGAGTLGSAGYLPQGHIWYNDNVKKYEFNIDKSKELLKGKELSFTLISGNSNEEIRIVELLKISMQKAGIRLDVKSMDSKSRDAALKNGNYELCINGTGGLGNDADNLRRVYTNQMLVSGKKNTLLGIPGYNNSQINELCNQQIFEIDAEKRKKLVYSLQEVISEEIPLIPLYNTTGYNVYRPSKYDGWKYMYNHHSVSHAKISYLDVK